MRFSATSILVFALSVSRVFSAPVPTLTAEDDTIHYLASRAKTAITGVPSVGQVVLIAPNNVNGLPVNNARGGAIPHPAIVLSDADTTGAFTVGSISHSQASPNADLSTLVPQSDLDNVKVVAKGSTISLEGQVFTGASTTATSTNMFQPNFDPATPATGLQTSSVNAIRSKLSLPALADPSDTTDATDDTAADGTADATADSSSGIVGDVEDAAKGLEGDAGSVVDSVAKDASGGIGTDVADAAEDVGKGLLDHLRRGVVRRRLVNY